MDPSDSYNAHQKNRQVYVVIRVDDGDAPLASRFTIVKILRRHDLAQAEVERLNVAGKGTHLWQVGWLAPDNTR
jgi:hypothetical protein